MAERWQVEVGLFEASRLNIPGLHADLAEMATFGERANDLVSLVEALRSDLDRWNESMKRHRLQHSFEHCPAADRDALQADLSGDSGSKVEVCAASSQNADQDDRPAGANGADGLVHKPGQIDDQVNTVLAGDLARAAPNPGFLSSLLSRRHPVASPERACRCSKT
jgi:hypothetical protein